MHTHTRARTHTHTHKHTPTHTHTHTHTHTGVIRELLGVNDSDCPLLFRSCVAGGLVEREKSETKRVTKRERRERGEGDPRVGRRGDRGGGGKWERERE